MQPDMTGPVYLGCGARVRVRNDVSTAVGAVWLLKLGSACKTSGAIEARPALSSASPPLPWVSAVSCVEWG